MLKGAALPSTLSTLLCAALVSCTSSGDVETVDPNDQASVVSSQNHALLGAASIARNYAPPNGIQGVGDGPAYSFGFTSEGAVSTGYNRRNQKLGQLGASMMGCGFSWSDVDRVDELGGAAPNASNCQDPPNPGDPMWEHHRPYKQIVSIDGVDYCISMGALNACDSALQQNVLNGMQNTALILNPPKAYSNAQCVAQTAADPGVKNPCIPTAANRVHLYRFMKFIAARYSTPAKKLSNFILFNEVNHTGYFSVHGLTRVSPRAGTIDVRSNELSEADKRQWASEYATLMATAHDGIRDAGRTDVMLWASIDPWFRDQYYPGNSWSISSQYIVDALKSTLGITKDWGISIHPYGDPNPYSSTSFGARTGSNPERYVFGNLNALSTQMADWVRSLGPTDPSVFPQTKLYASEQSYDGPRLLPATATSSYPFSFRRDERRIAEWVCRAHDAALRNPSIVAVTHNHFQQDKCEQLREVAASSAQLTAAGCGAAEVDRNGLVPAWLRGNWDSMDAYLDVPQVNMPMDVNRDFVFDGVAKSTVDGGVPNYVAMNNGTTRALPAREATVYDAYAATFRNGGWGLNNTHACCTQFNLGCAQTPASAAPIGTVDGLTQEANGFTLTGRACAPKIDAPIVVDVWAVNGDGSQSYVTGGPANLSNAGQPLLNCQNNYAEQRFSIRFTRDKVAAHQGKFLRVYAIAPQGTGPNTLLGGVTTQMPSLPADYNAINGQVDELVVANNLIMLRGWACAAGIADSILVDVYSSYSPAAGNYVKTAKADLVSEVAVNQQCGSRGSNYRFEIPFTQAQVATHQGRPLTLYGISPVGGANNTLARLQDFHMPALPAGYQAAGSITGWVESLNAVEHRYALNGWACLQGDPRSLVVDVWSGGWSQPTCAAGQSSNCKKWLKSGYADSRIEPSLKALCGNQGDFHRFEIPFTATEVAAHAGRPLQALVIHPGGAGPNPLLPKRQEVTMPALPTPGAPGYPY